MASPAKLLSCGQSYWLDNLNRDMLASGELERRVSSEGLRGMTSNPKIFDKAISKGEAYDEQIRELVEEETPIEKIYESLAVSDVRRACDVFRPVYDDSGGTDGFVSLEVSPYLAHDATGTMEEVRRLYRAVERPNVMIKIPGTLAGLDAIEEMLYEGINVNITLLFSIERYEAVAERHLRAFERRLVEGKSVRGIASVASFFLSRIDVLVDQLLSQRIVPEGAHAATPEHLFGEIALASAKLAYRSFQQRIRGERWRGLADAGASVQRLLWASTSTKNPLYSDVKYVEPLIGRDTVNTMPDPTIAAFADHGVLRCDSIEEGVDEAQRTLEALEETGISLAAVTWQLENEGVEKFVSPFDDLMGTLARKRRAIAPVPRIRLELDDFGPAAEAADGLDELQAGRRLFAGDASLWTRDAEKAESLRNRLGWLGCPEHFREQVVALRLFARDVREAFDRVILLGMGGSSLTAALSSEVFGVSAGHPELRVLDSTDPEAIAWEQSHLDPSRTLFVVASKSGTTTETLDLYRFFYGVLERQRGDGVSDHFVAITDPGSPLAVEAKERRFARVFENPPDIGGRYSALSYFGLVPMALQGVDVERLLDRAAGMRIDAGPEVPARKNPAIALGAALGAAARAGRNKVTFVPDGKLAPFAQWAEQLLAESTGKDGTGLVPVADEPLGEPGVYGDDRVFVRLALADERDEGVDERLEALEEAGHPVVRITLDDALDLGAEFLRWEIAVAVAGVVLGVDPFDEPNVSESKETTRRLLKEWASHHRFEEAPILLQGDHVSVRAEREQGWAKALGAPASLTKLLDAYLQLASPGDYLALLPYVAWTQERHARLRSILAALRDRLRVATTLGYGPRYLHSTGQLHKGGPGGSLFIVLTADTGPSIPIPGDEYGFETLERAQALGDLRALRDRDRRVLRIHLQNVQDGLDELADALGLA